MDRAGMVLLGVVLSATTCWWGEPPSGGRGALGMADDYVPGLVLSRSLSQMVSEVGGSMVDPQVQVPIAQLLSDDPEQIFFAAIELREIGDPVGVQPLIEALPRVTGPEVTDFDIPGNYGAAVIDALAALGDARAAPAIRVALTVSTGDVTIRAACQALVRLRDTAAVPLLERLLLDPDWIYEAEDLAPALAELGGEAQGEFLRGLLSSDAEQVVRAAVEALGQMRYRPAAPQVSALQAADDDWLAISAFSALVRMGAATLDDVRRTLSRAPESQKAVLIDLVAASGTDGAVDVAREYLADSAWTAGDDAFRAKMRAKAAQLGSADAVEDLRAVAGDQGASPCSRAQAAVGLLDLDDGEFLEVSLKFLRSAAHDRDSAIDPRDDWVERVRLREQTVDAAARFAARHDDALLPVVDVLDLLRRAQVSPAQDRAWRLVPGMTGTTTYPEFDAWRAAQSPA